MKVIIYLRNPKRKIVRDVFSVIDNPKTLSFGYFDDSSPFKFNKDNIRKVVIKNAKN